MNPKLIITICNGKILLVASGFLDIWIETSHDTRKIEPQVVTREQFDALLAGKMPEVIV
jgi:hypothetical protein